MHITRKRYGIWQIGLHHDVYRRLRFTAVSLSRYVKLKASGWFSQIQSQMSVITDHFAQISDVEMLVPHCSTLLLYVTIDKNHDSMYNYTYICRVVGSQF